MWANDRYDLREKSPRDNEPQAAPHFGVDGFSRQKSTQSLNNVGYAFDTFDTAI